MAVFPVQDVTDLDMAFPAKVSHLMPSYDEIPEEHKQMRGVWYQIFMGMFYGEPFPDVQVQPQYGIDREKAVRHLTVICRSYEPKHEHKEAAVVYLLSQWFKIVDD